MRELGRGTSGRVYLAEDKGLARKVAIKCLREPSGRVVTRTKEIAILKKLAHRNVRASPTAPVSSRLTDGWRRCQVVALHEVIEDKKQHQLYLVMDYAPGGALMDKLQAGTTLPVDDARIIFRNIVSGLEYLHAQHVIHRDLKPGMPSPADLDQAPCRLTLASAAARSAANILLGTSVSEVKIADFGVADVVDSMEGAEGTLGTPGASGPPRHPCICLSPARPTKRSWHPKCSREQRTTTGWTVGHSE